MQLIVIRQSGAKNTEYDTTNLMTTVGINSQIVQITYFTPSPNTYLKEVEGVQVGVTSNTTQTINLIHANC